LSTLVYYTLVEGGLLDILFEIWDRGFKRGRGRWEREKRWGVDGYAKDTKLNDGGDAVG
jgi:hypothetical protein